MQNAIGWLMQFGPFGFIALGVAVFATLGGIAMYGAYRRAKALQELAETLGFQFTPKPGLELLRRFPRFQLLTAGRSQQVHNLLSGSTESTQVMIFDWSYVTGSGKNSNTHHTTVVAIQSTELDLSPYLCRPETVLDWMGLTFDGRDIDFEDRPLFSKKYHLHGNNDKRVRQLFDVEVCEFFEQHAGTYSEGHREWLLYYQADRKVTPAKVADRFKEAFQLYVLLKGRSAASQIDSDSSTTAIPDQPRDEMSTESER